MLLNRKRITLDEVKPTVMISGKGKMTDFDFIMFKNGLKRRKMVHVKSEPNIVKNKVFTEEMLKQIKDEILANKLKEEEKKPVKNTSSFLCTSRQEGSSAPSL